MSPKQSKALLLLKAQVENAVEVFEETHPKASDWLKQQNLSLSSIRNDSNKSVGHKVAGEINRFNSTDAIDISKDEQKNILEKIISIAQLPPGQLNDNDALYLEQQISDLIGIEVVSRLENKTLPHNYGMIASGRHTKRYAGDKLELHTDVFEAGIYGSRSDFGWIKNGQDPEANYSYEEQEMYSINIQLQILESWQNNRGELKKWYKGRRVIVINPFNNKAVMATVNGTGPSLSSRRQFMGSPELIRALEAWSLEAQGRVMVLFVGGSTKVPLGSVALSQVV